MAINRLTDRKISGAKPRRAEYLIADGGGLFVRVRPDGARHFVFLYSLNGKRRKRGLGAYPAASLAAARKNAADCRDHVAKGTDPIEAVRAERQRQASRHTVKALFDEWKRRELKARRKDGGEGVREYFDRDVAPVIGNRFAAEITRRDIQGIIDTIAERGARRSANIVRAILRQMFGYALNREIVAADPTTTVRKLEGGDKERTRILSPDEVRELAEKLPACELAPRYQAAVWIMLATCCRVGELARARWTDLDLARGEWTIPAANSKNKRAHVIHLSNFARKQFEALPRFEGCDWIYPARDGKAAVHRKTISLELYDRMRETPLKKRSPKVGTLILSGGRWIPHDCRRSGATFMGELSIPPFVIDRCLNHIEASKVTRTYQRQELIPERRRAFERLGQHLTDILKGETGKIAVFPERVS